MVTILERVGDFRDLVSTHVTDWRNMGHYLGGVEPSRFAATGSKGVQSVSYRVLPQLFSGRIRSDDVLVDVGCGKGRVLSWWLRQGYRNAMIGLEIDETLARETRRRLRHASQLSVVSGDAIENLPENGTLFFLFNPFDRGSLVRFRDKLLQMRHSSRARVLYYNALDIDVFREDPGWSVVPIETRKCLDCAVAHAAFLVTPVASVTEQSPAGR